jgi:uncharacterized protein YodC (DUF2158 family)
MAEDFKAGDTVQLNSGGPKMTIDSLGPEDQYSEAQGAHVSWFDEKNKPQHGWYPLTSLKKVSPEARSGQIPLVRG